MLFAVGALILLSSITSIFNNLVVEGASARPFQQGADNMYNGYENSVQPYMYEKNNPNEYSSYDNYQPADYDNACVSSYNDGYAKTITMSITDTVNIQRYF